MGKTKIEWTNNGITWNPITGCSPASEGCKNCYARRMTVRLKAMGQAKYKNGFKPTFHPEVLQEIERHREPSIVFVCSMSDIFHKDISDGQIRRIFDVMHRNPLHAYIILTKRPERYATFRKDFESPNWWAGVTVENKKYVNRISKLTEVREIKNRFISFEPLLGDVGKINLYSIKWVIVGGETGPGARPFDMEWAKKIWNQATSSRVPFFFKKEGANPITRTGLSFLKKEQTYPRQLVT